MKCLSMNCKSGQTVLDVILAAKLAASKSEARRLVRSERGAFGWRNDRTGRCGVSASGCVAGRQAEIFEGEVIQQMKNGLVISLVRLFFILFNHGKENFDNPWVEQFSCILLEIV